MMSMASRVADTPFWRDMLVGVMAKHPGLGINGMPGGFVTDKPDDLIALADAHEQFTACMIWLEGVVAIKTINSQVSSYGIKHIVERALRQARDDGLNPWLPKGVPYVANGAFIAAALATGLQGEACGPNRTGPNMCFNISNRCLNDRCRRIDVFHGRRDPSRGAAGVLCFPTSEHAPYNATPS